MNVILTRTEVATHKTETKATAVRQIVKYLFMYLAARLFLCSLFGRVKKKKTHFIESISQ